MAEKNEFFSLERFQWRNYYDAREAAAVQAPIKLQGRRGPLICTKQVLLNKFAF